jgi:allophanate hydrolase
VTAAGADLVDVMVCGAHMSGLPLNKQLLERGAWQISTTRTAPIYRFYALPGGPPFRPGLVQVSDGGAAIDVEVWRMPVEHYGSFVAGIPAPLGIGKVKLEDGNSVSGFLCESLGVASATDISALGGWREYLRTRK